MKLIGRGVLTTPQFVGPFCREVGAQSTVQPMSNTHVFAARMRSLRKPDRQGSEQVPKMIGNRAKLNHMMTVKLRNEGRRG